MAESKIRSWTLCCQERVLSCPDMAAIWRENVSDISRKTCLTSSDSADWSIESLLRLRAGVSAPCRRCSAAAARALRPSMVVVGSEDIIELVDRNRYSTSCELEKRPMSQKCVPLLYKQEPAFFQGVKNRQKPAGCVT